MKIIIILRNRYIEYKSNMANPPLDECHEVENWPNLKLI